MHKITVLSFLLITLVTVDGCRSRQQTAAATDSTASAGTEPNNVDTEPVELTERLSLLGLTQTGHWRGISLGDPMTTVTTKEKEKPFEQDARHVGYTVEFPNLETADFLYYQENQKVSSIVVDLYLNNQASVDAYKKDLNGYFTRRYGQSTLKDKATVWTDLKQAQISLKDVSKGKDFGLKVKVTPVTAGPLTASVK